MKKAILGFLALGFAVASVTVRAESDTLRDRYVPGEARAEIGGRGREDFSDRRFNPAGGGIRGEREERSSRAGASVTRTAVAAPEMDPMSAASGLALLLGGIAVLLGQRKPI